MNEVIKYIFFFLVGTTVLNLGIAIAARVKTQNREFNQLVLYCSTLFLTFYAVATLNGSISEVAFCYFFQVFPAFLMCKMLMDSRGIKFNLNFYGSIYFLGALLSTYLILYTKVGFTISLLPVTFGTTLPYWSPIWNTLVSHRSEANWIEKGMGIMFITGVVNHFNYAFFRLDESAAWWGWSVSIAQYQCLSIFLPLLISHRRDMKERKNIELALEKISGENTTFNVEMDELYRTLELQIVQKEELTRKLRHANTRLEEEREINEILIKTVSHDLANPLTVINAYADMMNSGKIPPEDRPMIWDRIKMNTKSALDMIARIRDAIVTRNQASIVSIGDVNIARALQNLLTQFDSRLKEKNLSAFIYNDVNENTFAAAEEVTLTEHVFANILTNAIKFSYEGGDIIINVKETDNNILVEFKDFGTGINSERLEKRLLRSTEGTRGEQGSGFGIMVMGYFLRQFNAYHTISSDGPGTGTSVTISLKKSLAKPSFIAKPVGPLPVFSIERIEENPNFS